MTSFMNIKSSNNSTITIDGQSYSGKEAELRMFVDGKEQAGSFSGSIKIEIQGNCEEVETLSGDVQVNGDSGRVKTMSGDVRCGKVLGSVSTMSGDIKIK
jgi:DUF4097 and DUF4098 domain-containing protein YvlB